MTQKNWTNNSETYVHTDRQKNEKKTREDGQTDTHTQTDLLSI